MPDVHPVRDPSKLHPLPAYSDVDIPESRSFRLKTKLLGKALTTDQLEGERLGKPTALAIFADDALSSTAYATEEILRALLAIGGVGGIGLLAFRYVTPVTVAMIGILIILVFSYRQTIKAYPSSGGAYIVTKDNLGVIPAQIAGAALLTDYILTVAVSVSAGVAALFSVFSVLYPWRVPLTLVLIAVVTWGNLRGVKESGRIFAIPTYAFLLSMVLVIGVGTYRHFFGGGLDHVVLDEAQRRALEGTGTVGILLLLHAFASGGAAMTGVESISNGVTAFRPPEWKNARDTLTIMGFCLGVMFLGISWLASTVHAVPTDDKTVIAQIAQTVFGSGAIGHILFLFTQASTMLILVLAANTSFAGFPRLASFQADDAFMPRQLTKRGHRLVFSNGIISLAVAAAVLVVILRADVSRLIPLYAVGVFTSFTLSQAGMARYHLRLREPRWRVGLFINGLGAIATAVVTVIVGTMKFMHGAWVITIIVPVLVFLLMRLNRQYESETEELSRDAQQAMSAPILRYHTVLVLIEKLDRSAALAMQYARALHPDDIKAVHIAVDRLTGRELSDEWAALPLSRIPLEIVDCPDRRINRSVLEVVTEAASTGDTEVTVLIPRRVYPRFWHRLLHDRTSDSIAHALADVSHANVTFVPYRVHAGGRG